MWLIIDSIIIVLFIIFAAGTKVANIIPYLFLLFLCFVLHKGRLIGALYCLY